MAGHAAQSAGGQLRPARPSSGKYGIEEKRREAMSKLTLTTEGDTHVIVKRHFAAKPEAVYRAHIDPKLVQQWMLGPEGWTMPVCICEARPGGRIRFEWSDGKGGGFYLTGEFIELIAPSRIVHV